MVRGDSHPLQTFSSGETDVAGCGCAIAGSTADALEVARRLALDLGMEPVEIDDSRRAAYHAAASIASNFLVTLEATAEKVAGGAGIEPDQARRLLGPLVRTTVENWLVRGPERALTGPVARGDEETVARQRAAVAEASPEALALFDQLVRDKIEQGTDPFRAVTILRRRFDQKLEDNIELVRSEIKLGNELAESTYRGTWISGLIAAGAQG